MSAPAIAVPCTRCAIHAESVFRVAGMCCAEEAAILERRLTPLPGVESLSVDIMGQTMRVAHDAAVVSAANIADAVAQTGMRAWLEHERPIDVPTTAGGRAPLVVAGAAIGLGLLAPRLGVPAQVSWPFFAAAVAVAGRQPAAKALVSLRRRTLDIHVLMLVAVVGAVALGEWAEAATVIWLFAVSQWLEVHTMERAREAIRGVMTLAPAEALVRHGDHVHATAVDRIVPGAVVLVPPGHKVPLDGVVTSGRSDVNQAPITGESLPVSKAPGDELFAGTINGAGALDMQVTRAVRDTTLARIVHLVEEAQAQRAPSQQFIDRFAHWYTPAVVAIAALVFLAPVLVAGGDPAAWAYRALVLLVVACPCALVISTPVSIVAALATAARHGVLMKGGAHLERLAGIRVVAFDKTGTLTTGTPTVATVTGGSGVDLAEALAIAAGVEQHSRHPVAQAVLAATRERGVSAAPVTEVVERPGLGVEARHGASTVAVGNEAFARAQGLSADDAAAQQRAHDSRGETPIYLLVDGRLRAVFGVRDTVRPVAADVVRLMREHGIDHVALLTGDAPPAAAALARQTALTDVRAGLMPADKLAAVRELRQAFGPIAMVGDGVNDAPALAAADVGVAMGAAGSAAALEAADVALMSDELQKLPYALRLSRATLANVRMNVAISLGLKGIVLVLAVLGWSTLWMAVLADTGASVLVVANAMRLLRHQ